MLEEINRCDLISGNSYFIKSINRVITITNIKFIHYTEINDERTVGLFDTHILGMCLINHNDWIIYRYVSSKEYKEKIREKYNATCLHIILKRLINESFTW